MPGLGGLAEDPDVATVLGGVGGHGSSCRIGVPEAGQETHDGRFAGGELDDLEDRVRAHPQHCHGGDGQDQCAAVRAQRPVPRQRHKGDGQQERSQDVRCGLRAVEFGIEWPERGGDQHDGVKPEPCGKERRGTAPTTRYPRPPGDHDPGEQAEYDNLLCPRTTSHIRAEHCKRHNARLP